MSMNINSAKSKAPAKKNPVPMDGVQLGVIVQVVDLGVQPGSVYQGEKKPDERQIRLTYELPNDVHEFDGEEKPLLISETFKFSGHEKSTCYKRINTIDPGLKLTGGDYANLIGKAVMVQIVHKDGKGKHVGRVFANVAAVSPLMRGMSGPDSTFNPVYFYSPDSHDEEVWGKMPEFLQNIVNGRLDSAATRPASSEQSRDTSPDEPPFEVEDSSSDEEW